MACMKSGVLVNLLEEMNHNEKGLEEDRKHVLLQIRSIIPVLEEGDLWPNRGFYLKVSDLSHAIYVSLPEEQNDMILSNKLKLGQLIYVQRLDPSHPVPVLRGITPVPGRRPCDGTRADILPASNLVKFLQASDNDLIVEKGVISEKKISDSRKFSRGSSDTEVSRAKRGDDIEDEGGRGRARSSSVSKSRPGEPRLGLNYVSKRCDVEKKIFEVMVEINKARESSVENDSDSDSTKSSISSVQSHLSKRRSWTESELFGSKEIFDSSTVKHENGNVTRSRSRSAHVSPVRCVKCDSSDENSSSMRRRRDMNPPKKLLKSSNKTRLPTVRKKQEELSYPSICSSVEDIKDAENRIPWDSLPSSLVKLGKEVIRERDAAILAAVEALQEACAAQRLIRCLSTYSEFHESSGEEGLQNSVDKFFDLQDGLSNSKLITHSLTNISPVRTSSYTDLSSCTTVKEVLDIALERKKNASSWVKSAVTLDLCPFADSSKLLTTESINSVKKPVSANQAAVKSKGASIMIRKQRRNSDIPIVHAADKDDQVSWSRGSTLPHTAELATSLQDECHKWFLNHIEKYLDEVENKVAYMESDNQRAGMMFRIKRVNDWLETIGGKEKDDNKDSCTLNEADIEACGRVKNKIYGILLKQVERTAMALETM